MFKWVAGLFFLSAVYFFWIEPEILHRKQYQEKDLMKVLQEFSVKSAREPEQAGKLKSLIEKIDLNQADNENNEYSNEISQTVFLQTTQMICSREGFSERFGVTKEECVSRSMKAIKKCESIFVDLAKKLLTDPEQVPIDPEMLASCQ